MPSLKDQLLKAYFFNLRGRKDFGYLTRGIRTDKDNDLLLVGPLSFNGNLIKITPKLVIGSDRLELYEFLSRRKEVWNIQNRNWFKLSVALTGAHFFIVRVPELFSRFFGDEVGALSSSLGAQDQSNLQQQLKVARDKPRSGGNLA
jgi:hypothetical protein